MGCTRQVAWLFNIRGADIPFNPVTVAHTLVTTDAAVLFAPDGAINDAVRRHLDCADVVVRWCLVLC